VDAGGDGVTIFLDTWDYLTAASSWTGEGGMLQLLLQQLLLTVTALLIAVAVGLPLALWLGHLGRGGFLAINVSNIGRAVPTFALLALLVTMDVPGRAELGPYGRAGLATLLALAAFALPPIITNAYVAVREVPAEVKESARGMGMTGRQQFFRAELPLALPLVASGLRLALVQVWATATIAALVAGPGLGRVITDGFYRTNYGKGIAGAVVVAAVALVLELLAAAAQRAVTPPGVGGSPGRADDMSGGARRLDPAVATGERQREAPAPDTRGRHGRGTQKVVP
jgi:osmoprotectant transport system permease protein